MIRHEDAPPEMVVAAFGRRGSADRVPGGQGGTWLIDGVVLKHHEDPLEAAWVQGIASQISDPAFRIAPPIRAEDGSWVVDGWSANEHLPGLAPAAPAWANIAAAGRAFSSAATAVAPSPGSALRTRTHRWAVADRCAWGEEQVDLPAASTPVCEALRVLTAAVDDLPPALIHADLAQNVHVDSSGQPVILDLSLYLRPARWADAIVIADAVTWLGAEPGLATTFAADRIGLDLLARALIFRLVAEQTGPLAGRLDAIEPYERIADLLG